MVSRLSPMTNGDVERADPTAAVAGRNPLPPLFRWPGGKRWLVSTLLEIVPDRFERYYEPFFGAGALFFALRPRHSVIADLNTALTSCLAQVRDHPADVERLLRSLPRDEAAYYRIRAQKPTDPIERAARLIYLTTLAFNGIHRVNRRGDFNVPYGGRQYPTLGSPGQLVGYSDLLRQAEIRNGDFAETVADAGRGDLVYLDPPYTVRHDNNGFLRYNERIFSMLDQERLGRVAQELSDRGACVVVSNAAHPSVIAQYPSFRMIRVQRTSAMAADPTKRGRVEEVVFTNAR